MQYLTFAFLMLIELYFSFLVDWIFDLDLDMSQI
jgi:hypothetical protein